MGSLPHQADPARAADRLILALDFPSGPAALHFLDRLSGDTGHGRLRWVKVGLELFLSAGSGVVAELKTRGYHVFLDLKLHDIPNTVAAAIRALGSLEPDLLTVHASGGPAMISAAAEAAAALKTPPRLLAVTVLTSMSAEQLAGTGVPASPLEQTLRLAQLACQSGVHGLVGSPQEAAALTRALPGVHLVTPGIRSAGDAPGDQQRVATAQQALSAGATQLVVGRPITQAAAPAAALDRFLVEIHAALGAKAAQR